MLELTRGFNLALLCVVSFGLPRLILLITARAPQLDTVCTPRQRVTICLVYFALVFLLAWFGTWSFESLPDLVRDTMGD